MGMQFASEFVDLKKRNNRNAFSYHGISPTDGAAMTKVILKYCLAVKNMDLSDIMTMSSAEKNQTGMDMINYLKSAISNKDWEKELDEKITNKNIDFDDVYNTVETNFGDKKDEPEYEEDFNLLENKNLFLRITEEDPEPLSDLPDEEQDKQMKEFFVSEAAESLEAIASSVSYGTDETLESDKRYKTLTTTEDGDRYLAFKEADDPQELYYKVEDRKAYNRLKKDTASLIETTEELIDRQVESGKLGNDAALYMKAVGTGRAKRALRGYSNTYLATLTPLAEGISDVSFFIDAENSNGQLDKNINKWRDKFPVHELIIEGENQLNTLADYYDDKSKNKITPAKEKQYRNALYAETIRMINLTNAVNLAANDPKLNKEIKADGILENGIDPLALNPNAPEGALTLTASLEAYKFGLENGWTIEDLGVLAAFNKCLEGEKKRVNFNVDANLDKPVPYDAPKYKSEKQKAYLEKMETLFETIKSTKITSKATRDKLMIGMYDLVKEGKKKKYLRDGVAISDFGDIYIRNAKRDHSIMLQQDTAFSKAQLNVEKERAAEMNLLLARFNTDRSKWFITKESNEHKQLRESVQKMINSKKDVQLDSNAKVDNILLDDYEQYFHNLEEAIADSRYYQSEKRKTPGTEGGKERLKGAKGLEDIAKNERNSLVKFMNKYYEANHAANSGEPFKPATLEEIRIKMAENAMNRGKKTILQFEDEAITKDDKAAIIDAAANILVYKFATIENDNIKTAFNNMGFNKLKDQVTKSSEFKSLMKGYLKSDVIDVKQMVEDLQGPKAIMTMEKTNRNLNKAAEKHSENLANAEAQAKAHI